MKPIAENRNKGEFKHKGIVLLCILVLLTSCTDKRDVKYETANLVRVVDGDTMLVDRGQGEEYLRLIGIDAPESVHPDPNRNTEDGRRASAFLHSLMKNVTMIFIVRDISETDKYGRLLRYVWMVKPSDKNAEIRSGMVNAILLLEGYASNVTNQPDVRYAELFLEFVREARKNHVGLWE